MRYLLDTDHISIIQRKTGNSYQRLRLISTKACSSFIPTIVAIFGEAG